MTRFERIVLPAIGFELVRADGNKRYYEHKDGASAVITIGVPSNGHTTNE